MFCHVVSVCQVRVTVSPRLFHPCWPLLLSKPSTSWRRIQVTTLTVTLFHFSQLFSTLFTKAGIVALSDITLYENSSSNEVNNVFDSEWRRSLERLYLSASHYTFINVYCSYGRLVLTLGQNLMIWSAACTGYLKPANVTLLHSSNTHKSIT